MLELIRIELYGIFIRIATHAPVNSRTVGLMNPTDDLPTARRASLMEVIKAAVTGVEQEVPNTLSKLPFTAIA